MRERAVRRVLVCDTDRQLVGIISLGDLAVRHDPRFGARRDQRRQARND